jgi:hypothetical protein
MIVAKLEGGLGNQMFQYAMGKLLSLRNKDKLFIDHSYFLHLTSDPKVTKYVYALGVFPKIKERAVTVFDMMFLTPIMIPLLAYRSEQIYKKLHLGNIQVIHEKNGLAFDKSMTELSGHLYMQGFWQHYGYLSLIEKEIRRIFTFDARIQKKVTTILKGIPLKNRVAVHVRRGDYLALGLGVCSLEYYRKAFQLMKKKVKDPHFVVVSNDIDWARANLKFLKPALFVNPQAGSEAIDMCLISQCSHNIIANSSFSWWGAWLNPNPKKVVIAPTPWLDFKELADKSPVPPNWITLPK